MSTYRTDLAQAARAVSARLGRLPDHYRETFDATSWAELCDRARALSAGGDDDEALAVIEAWRDRVLSSLPKPRAKR
jgi:hypothetical protein